MNISPFKTKGWMLSTRILAYLTSTRSRNIPGVGLSALCALNMQQRCEGSQRTPY